MELSTVASRALESRFVATRVRKALFKKFIIIVISNFNLEVKMALLTRVISTEVAARVTLCYGRPTGTYPQLQIDNRRHYRVGKDKITNLFCTINKYKCIHQPINAISKV